MARQALDYDTRTKTARAKLDPRAKPYFRQIATGKTLGYIRREDAAGSWLVRERKGGRYAVRTLGQADDLAPADGVDVLAYAQALRQVTHPHASAKVGKLTVAAALDAYLTALASRSTHADEYRATADKHIVPVLGPTRVDRLTKTDLANWQAGLVRDGGDEDRRRSQDSANRILTILRAALNAAFQDEANNIATDAAWRRVKPYAKVGRPRTDDLEAGQVRILVAMAATFDPALAHLIEAAFLTGARTGELAALDVRDLDADNSRLSIRSGKTGPRVVTLTRETVDFLQRLAVGRDLDAPLLPRGDGARWPRSGHCLGVAQALALANLPASASLYTLRHAHISRAIEAGMPLSLLSANCGTSLVRIEKNYAHVLARTRLATVQKTSPKLRAVK